MNTMIHLLSEQSCMTRANAQDHKLITSNNIRCNHLKLLILINYAISVHLEHLECEENDIPRQIHEKLLVT